MSWDIEYYEDLNAFCPVEEFLDRLSIKERARIFQAIQLLEEFGPTLAFPFSSQVEGRLRELRTQHGKARFRILYYADMNRSFVLLHAIRKQTEKLGERDKKIALDRMAIDMEHKRQRR